VQVPTRTRAAAAPAGEPASLTAYVCTIHFQMSFVIA
jgi:hypothetical protein